MLDLPSSEPDRPSEGEVMYDSDKDPEYKPSDCSESEYEQFFANSDQSDTFEEDDHASEDLGLQQPDDPADYVRQASDDPGEGTSNPDSVNNSQQAPADSDERLSTLQPRNKKRKQKERGKNRQLEKGRLKIVWNRVE